MKNKHKKIFKKCWYLSPLGLMFVMVPAIMSSCANISQYILPITTGVGMKGPFSNSYINGINDFFDQSLNTYLPTQYISYINRSGGNNVSSYGFDNPDNIDNNTPFG
jgi:hypothetical protein